jgi:5-methylcytosine-specific restriction endonuclease McrA
MSANGHTLVPDRVFDMIAEEKGGETIGSNLQTLCRSYNSKKGSREA